MSIPDTEFQAPEHQGGYPASPSTSVAGSSAGGLDVERDSDVPISTQIYWQIAYQIDSGRLQPGDRLAPVRELGAALRVNPNTIRAVYRRLADAGYVTSRHGAGTRVCERPPQRRGDEALAGVVAEMIRRAAQAGFTADEVAAATFAAATERKRPGPRVRMLVAECTPADAAYDAEKLAEAFPDSVEAEGTLLEELRDRLDRFHYDLVATTTFHAAEAQLLVGGRVPVTAIMVGAGYVGLVREVASLPTGATVGLVCATPRGADNIAETLRLSGRTGMGIVSAHPGSNEDLDRVDKEADLILMSREALAMKLDERFSRPERIREWTYEFDPSGIELLRRQIEQIQAARREAVEGTSISTTPSSESRQTATPVARR
jgi:DNA-binding transcriptional regulator YhcF (GntR family)